MISTAEPNQNLSASAYSTVLSVDPGRTKCGIAVVDSSGAVLYRGIVPTMSMRGAILDACAQFAPTSILLGNGTGAASIFAMLDEIGLAVPVHRVDERYSSEQARAIYIKDHPARGFRRLLPKGLRYPDSAYDDYVAVLLARRWWQTTKDDHRRPSEESALS
jgi:RNase H-fold protein (predicted Holliday junction resolvase)